MKLLVSFGHDDPLRAVFCKDPSPQGVVEIAHHRLQGGSRTAANQTKPNILATSKVA
jgi:hypothetical protein